MFDPSLGRWLTLDPVGVEPDENMYRYNENDPISNLDPMGLRPEQNSDIKFEYQTSYEDIEKTISDGKPGFSLQFNMLYDKNKYELAARHSFMQTLQAWGFAITKDGNVHKLLNNSNDQYLSYKIEKTYLPDSKLNGKMTDTRKAYISKDAPIKEDDVVFLYYHNVANAGISTSGFKIFEEPNNKKATKDEYDAYNKGFSQNLPYVQYSISYIFYKPCKEGKGFIEKSMQAARLTLGDWLTSAGFNQKTDWTKGFEYLSFEKLLGKKNPIFKEFG